MIPFFQANSIELGPLTIQVWGLLVALGMLAGLIFGARLVKKQFLSVEVFLDLALYSVLGAFIGARLVHVSLYQPGYYGAHPLEILKVWQGGLSSLGGFSGGLLGAALFARYRKFSLNEFARYADVGIISIWLGWGIGRLGCFLIHDHPGTLSNFVLATRYPEGPRHDLGLYESITGFILFFVFWALFKKLSKKQSGLVALVSAGVYAVIRFGLDFLRASDLPASDARYLYLTPAQWGMIAVIAGLTGACIYTKMRQSKRGEVA